MSSEVSFEQRFGQLVDAELNDKLPSLVEYRVGFQVIDKADDETKAVGVYAFVMNNTWLYLPIFFIDGKLEGFELLYLKDKDLFVPAMDNWVAAINDQGLQVLGQAVAPGRETDESLAATAQNTNTFSGGGSMSKVAAHSYNILAYDNNSPLEKEAVVKMFTSYTGSLKDVVPNLERDLIHSLGKEARSIFLNTFLSDPTFANSLFRHYSVNQMEKLAKECAKDRQCIIKDEGTVKYITRNMSKEAKDLADEEKTLLVKHGLYIQDHRTNFSKVYQEEVDTNILQNPTTSGIYDVLMADGTMEKRIIILPKELDSGNSLDRRSSNVKRKVALITIGEGKNFEWRDALEIYCKPATGLSSDLLKDQRGGIRASLRSMRDIPEGANVLLVQNTKRAIKTRLSHRRKDASGAIVVTLEGSTGYGTAEPSHYNHCNELTINFTEGGKLCIKGDVLYVPSDEVRVFVDYPLWMARDKDSTKGPNGGEIAKITYGHPTLIKGMVYGNTGMNRVSVQMSPQGNYGTVQDANGHSDLLPKEAVARILCEGLGISGGDVMRMMKQASQDTSLKASFLIKTAAPYDLSAYRGSSFTPFMGGPGGKVDSNVKREEVDSRTGRALSGAKASDGQSILPTAAIKKAESASASGIKEVLDTKVLEQLIDKADISELRKDYISEMIQGMDSIGRMLFLYYWHNDQFEDKYGREKMRELQEHLKDVFSSTGDLVLFLKEKTTFNPDQTESVFGNLSEDIATADV